MGDEVVERLRVAGADRVGDHLGGAGFGFGFALARFGVAEGGFAAAFGLQDLALLLTLGTQDFGGAGTFGIEDVGALFAFGLHLAAHGADDVGGRADVLEFDAGDLDAPGVGRLIDHGQEAGVDLVALGQSFVEVHRAHDGAQVGGGELHDRHVQFGDFIGGLGGVQHLEEDHAVDRHHGIILGDDLLPRNIDHLLHHVDLATHGIEEGGVEIEARLGDFGEAAEAFDRILIALPHHLHADREVEEHEAREREREGGQHHGLPKQGWTMRLIC